MSDVLPPLKPLSLSCELPGIDLSSSAVDKVHVFFDRLTREAESCVKRIATSDPAFLKRKQELSKAIREYKDVTEYMPTYEYIRPLFSLWLDNNDGERLVKEECPPTPALLNILNSLIKKTPQNCIGILVLLELCQVFFMRYKVLGEYREGFGRFIREHIQRRTGKKTGSVSAELQSAARHLFTDSGHKWLDDEAGRRHIELSEMADILKIDHRSDIFRYAMGMSFIRKLKALAPNENASVLNELNLSKVSRLIWENGQYLGHSALSLLIDKLEKAQQEPCQQWKDIILSVAGDPRLSEHTGSYREWWSVLGRHRTDLMRGWLSRFDMELFLRIISKFAESDECMHSMFPQRKKLLDYIFRHNEVKMTRLFIGVQTEQFVKEWSHDSKAIFFTPIKDDPKLAVFYYRIGNIHIVEGTHNFAMRILNNLPQNCALNRYAKFEVRHQLGKGLENAYSDAVKSGELQINRDGFKEVKHHGKWMKSAIAALKERGILIKESELLSREEWIDYHS